MRPRHLRYNPSVIWHVSLLLVIALIVLCLSGCDSLSENNTDTGAEQSTEQSTDGVAYGLSEEDFLVVCLNYYEDEHGYRPRDADVSTKDGNTWLVHLYSMMREHTATSVWYNIDITTLQGTDMNGNEIDLTDEAMQYTKE